MHSLRHHLSVVNSSHLIAGTQNLLVTESREDECQILSTGGVLQHSPQGAVGARAGEPIHSRRVFWYVSEHGTKP